MQFLRFLVVIFAVYSFIPVGAQNEVQGNLWHLHEKFQKSTQPLVLYVQGDLEKIYLQSEKMGANYRHSFRGYHSFLVPGEKFLEFVYLPAVIHFVIEGGRGYPLVNKSRQNTRANSPIRYRGDTLKPYTGKGVIMGIIDSGIDFNHPDFNTEKGKTRVLKLWDQTRNQDTTLRPTYGYGEVYDSASINSGSCPHTDPNRYHGHGTMVTGIAAGNGLSVPDTIADYRGYATESDMIIVANDFSATNWTQTIADAVDWIFKEADKMNRPCVINISAGTYLGSHDGIDLPAQYIDSIMNAQPGRIVVGAAGNAGGVPGFHLHAKVNGDTSFTWFKVNPSTGFGGPAVFAELWADSAQFNQITFSIGATDTSTWTDTTFVYANIKQRLDTLITTPLGGGTQLMTWAERQADVYLLQFLITQPNASNYYKFGITGTGEYDCWSAAWLGMSDMVRSKLPSSTAYPNIKNYKLPDSLQSVVSSWNCHPNIVSVANYNNRLEYENVDGGMRQTVNFPVLGIAATSSRGPNRRGVLKPDLAAPGNFTLTSGRLVDVNYLANTPSQRFKLAKGGYHFTNGGTSMAAPVVSGIAALLLEKCPNMNAVEIRQALYNTTFSDSFATTLPNVRWGRGKVDAQAALEFTHSYDSIQSSKTNFAFCEGDSLSLTLFNLNHNISYWLHGDTGVQIVKVDSSNYLTDWKAYFTNIEGCKGYTEIQKTTMNALPQFNIEGDTIFCLEEGDSLFATSPDSTLKWLWSGGDTTSFLPISVSGTYSLVATTPMGCSDSTTHFTQGILCYAGLEDVKSQSIKVYPNPSKGNLTIDLDGEWECLRIFDARGKMVWSSTTPLNKILKIPVLQPGVYSLTSGNWVQKIVIYD